MMAEMTEDDRKAMDRLPRWARNEIERLRADLDAANKRTQAALGETPTLVEVERYRAVDGEPRCYLRDHASVTFSVDGGTIDVHLRDGVLEILGSDIIQIQPRSANLIWVRVER